MKITIVNFIAFRSHLTHVFYRNETDHEMHIALTKICANYEVTEIIVTEEAENRSLKCLTNFKTKTPCSTTEM